MIAASMPANHRKTPHEAVGLRDYIAGMLMTCSEEMTGRFDVRLLGDTKFGWPSENVNPRVLRGLGREMSGTDVVLWNTDLWSAAQNGAWGFAKKTISQEWVNPWPEGRAQLWIFETSYMVAPAWKKIWSLSCECDVVAVYVTRPVGLKTGAGLFVLIPNIPDITRVNDGDFDTIAPFLRIDPFFHQSAAGIEFMSMTIVGTEPHVWPRPERRRAQRARVELPRLSVLKLRRQETVKSLGLDTSPDWQHRWLVRGHWRNQWHPSLQEHKMIFIDTHLKGPEGMPLLPPKQSIYAVVR